MDKSLSLEIAEGIRLFNSTEFFEAHEVLEEVWRVAPEPDRRFFQGLIQVAVAFHHRSCGNMVGFRSVLARACHNLSGYPGLYQRVNLAALLCNLEEWRAAVDSPSAPPLPTVKFDD